MSTAIEWCDETWNPVVGCSRVSAGCYNCYAIGVAGRNLCEQHRGLTKVRPKGSSRPGQDWTGEVRTLPARLGEPLKWRKPRRVFVNSMSDLFHDRVPFEFVAAVFGVMSVSYQHTFLILTKRPARGVEFFEWLSGVADVEGESQLGVSLMHAADLFHDTDHERWDLAVTRSGREVNFGDDPWPLPNVQLLVSAEDQAAWDERVPLLSKLEASVRGVSAEPLLGPIEPHGIGALDWIVIGGESGPGARDCDVSWIRSLAAKAGDGSVATFVKQLGSRSVGGPPQTGKGNDMAQWPSDLRVQQLPAVES